MHTNYCRPQQFIAFVSCFEHILLIELVPLCYPKMDDLLATDARDNPDRTMGQLIVYYSDKHYSRIKYFFEQYYGLNSCHIVYRNSGVEISRHTLVKHWKLNAAVKQDGKQALVHRSATKFLKRWMQDPTAEIIDIDAASVCHTPNFQAFERIPATFEGRTIELGYELQNLNKLVQYMYHNFVTPNFARIHPIYKAAHLLYSEYTLQGQLDSVLSDVCFRKGIDTVPIHNVFGDLGFTELACTRVFCGNEMIVPRLVGNNWKYHPKKRPFPNCFSPMARQYVDGLLVRYCYFLGRVRLYVKKYAYDSRGISKQIDLLQRQVEVMRSVKNPKEY